MPKLIFFPVRGRDSKHKVPETEVDLQSWQRFHRPRFFGLNSKCTAHPAVVVPASGGIQLRNSFEALSRNDADDIPTDGNAVVTETGLPDSDRGHGEPVEEAVPMEARPVDLSEEFNEGCMQGRSASCLDDY